MVTAEVCSAIPIDAAAPAEAPNRGGVSSSEAFEPRWPSPPRRDPPIPRISERDDYMYADRSEADVDVRPVLAELLKGLAHGLDDLGPWGLDARLRTCPRHEQRLDSQVAALLSVISKTGVHRVFALASASRYAEELLGFSQRKAQLLLRIERAVQRSPELARAYPERGDLLGPGRPAGAHRLR